MSNPYFSNNAAFKAPRGTTITPYPPSNPYPPSTPHQPGSPYQPAEGAAFEQVQQSYYSPAATSFETGRLTFDDVVNKSALILGTVIVVALGAALMFPDALLLPATLAGLLTGIVLGLVNAFKREPSPALIMVYAVAQGLFLGGISKYFEQVYPGIVWQAVAGTAVTFAITLMLFKSGKVRVTPKFTRFLLIAVLSYAAFSLVNLGVMIFAPEVGAFGLRSATSPVLGLPWGVVIGVVAIGLAAMTLIVDFDSITNAVANGVPNKYAWSAGFGLAVSLIWLYLEFLRLLAILRGND